MKEFIIKKIKDSLIWFIPQYLFWTIFIAFFFFNPDIDMYIQAALFAGLATEFIILLGKSSERKKAERESNEVSYIYTVRPESDKLTLMMIPLMYSGFSLGMVRIIINILQSLFNLNFPSVSPYRLLVYLILFTLVPFEILCELYDCKNEIKLREKYNLIQHLQLDKNKLVSNKAEDETRWKEILGIKVYLPKGKFFLLGVIIFMIGLFCLFYLFRIYPNVNIYLIISLIVCFITGSVLMAQPLIASRKIEN